MCKSPEINLESIRGFAELIGLNARGVGKFIGLCRAWKRIMLAAEDLQVMSLFARSRRALCFG